VNAYEGRLVRYHSPFGASVWLPLWQARSYLEQDGKRWSKLEELDMVSARQRHAGPPTIELS
jgi:hypothetical protein